MQWTSVGNTVWLSAYTGSGTLPRLIRSTDAGATWNSWEINLTGGATNQYYIRSINFLDENVGYLVDRAATSANFGYIHKTTDGGATWSDTIAVNPAAPHGTQELRAATPIRGTNIVVVTGQDFTVATANRGRVWWSTDGGANFTPVAAIGGELWKAAFKSATEGLVVGNQNALKFSAKNVRKVTLNLNTSTVPDTLPVTGQTIQVRGGVNHAGGFSPITWGSEAQNNMTNVGGDYWKKTMYMQVGDTLSYKYVIAYSSRHRAGSKGVVPVDYPSQTGANRSLDRARQGHDGDRGVLEQRRRHPSSSTSVRMRPLPDSFFTVYFRVNMNGDHRGRFLWLQRRQGHAGSARRRFGGQRPRLGPFVRILTAESRALQRQRLHECSGVVLVRRSAIHEERLSPKVQRSASNTSSF